MTKIDFRLWFVYRVVDHKGSIRYIGSAVNPYSRMLSHHLEARKIVEFPGFGGNRFCRWLASEIELSQFPDVVPISAHQSRSDAFRAEQYEILSQLHQGSPLLNTNYEQSIRIRISAGVLKQLGEYADEKQRTRAAVAEDAIAEYVTRKPKR